MRTVKLTNSTDVRLVHGPLTVFAAGVYAGDAQLEFLSPGDHQLFNYARDVDLRIRSRISDEARAPRQSRVLLGTVVVDYLATRQHKYRAENRSDEVRTRILEQPRENKVWRLASNDQAWETTDAYYRFKLSLPANATVEYAVDEQCTQTERLDLATAELKQLEQLLTLKLAKDVQAVIQEVRDLRHRAADLNAAAQLDQSALNAITTATELDRIRANMGALARDSELYKNYVKKMTEQETKLDEIQGRIQQRNAQATQIQQQLRRYLQSVAPGAPEADPFR
jgi:hypothetical protein